MGQSPGRPGRRSHGWALRALLVGERAHCDPPADPISHNATRFLATPVPRPAGSDGVPAVLAGVLDLDGFAPDLVGPLEADRGTVVAAINAPGTTLLFRHPGDYAGRRLSAAGDPGSALFQTKGFDGIERLFRVVTAPGLARHVVAGTPVSVASAPPRRSGTR